MLAIWVKVRIKPEKRQGFLDAIEVDTLGSEKDEPGCLRFNVLPDEQDENVYYFCEVYTGPEALEAHLAAPHYAVWREAAHTLDGPAEAIRCRPVFPASASYWGERPGGGHEAACRRERGKLPRAERTPGAVSDRGPPGRWQ